MATRYIVDGKNGEKIYVSEIEAWEITKAARADIIDRPANPSEALNPSVGARGAGGIATREARKAKDAEKAQAKGGNPGYSGGFLYRNDLGGIGGGRAYGGINSLDQVDQLLETGWPEGHKKATDFIEKVRQEVNYVEVRSNRRVGVWGDSGDWLSVDRYVNRDMDNAFRSKKRKGRGFDQSVTLYAPWDAFGSMTKESFFWQGATAIALCDILEEQGYSVDLFACIAGYLQGTYDHLHCDMISLKRGGEPLRPEIATVFMSHVGIFRTLGWQVIAANESCRDTLGGLIAMESMIAQHGFGIPQGVAVPVANSEASCRRCVEQVIKKLNMTGETGSY